MALLLLDRRQAVEIALDALGEVVPVGAHHSELRLTSCAIAPGAGVGPDAGRDPGPLRSHESGDGGGEQSKKQPAHGAILAIGRNWPDRASSRGARSADNPDVTTSSVFLVPWAMVWIVLLRALLVQADILPRTCRKCGLPLERRAPGDDICRCQ